MGISDKVESLLGAPEPGHHGEEGSLPRVNPEVNQDEFVDHLMRTRDQARANFRRTVVLDVVGFGWPTVPGVGC